MTPPIDEHGVPLTLLSVHAHPDDEASKGAATVALYAAQGIRSVLVCCTGGEEGDILNPHVDTPEVRANLAEVRAAELQASADAIGYDALYVLGYRDSGMAGTEANAHPDSFASAPLDEAVERLVRIIRAERARANALRVATKRAQAKAAAAGDQRETSLLELTSTSVKTGT